MVYRFFSILSLMKQGFVFHLPQPCFQPIRGDVRAERQTEEAYFADLFPTNDREVDRIPVD